MSYIDNIGAEKIVHEIKAKCDDTYALRKEGLPYVVSSNNGNILKVANGAWTATTLEATDLSAVSINLNSGTTWSALYTKLSTIPTNYVGVYRSIAGCSNVLTDTKVNALMFGTVAHLTDTIFEFIARQANTADLYIWRITFNSTYKSATVGTVYKISGTAV